MADFYEKQIWQIENKEIIDGFKKAVIDYFNQDDLKWSNVIKEYIISRSWELTKSQLQILRDFITQKIKEETWKKKLKLYELFLSLKKMPEINEKLWNIDFRVLSGSMYIWGNWYIMDIRQRPEIKAIWNNFYEMEVDFLRDSKSSLRWPEKIKLNFYYDGVELIFFGDKNKNYSIDRNESGVRYIIKSKEEIIKRWNKKSFEFKTMDIKLDKAHISSHSYSRIHDFSLKILFN